MCNQGYVDGINPLSHVNIKLQFINEINEILHDNIKGEFIVRYIWSMSQ